MKRPMIPEIDGCKVLYNNKKKKLSHARDHPRHLYFCPSCNTFVNLIICTRYRVKTK